MWCDNCELWQLIEGDIYCSWCNRSVFHLETLADPIRVYIDPQNPRDYKFSVIRNSSYIAVSVTCDTPPPWLTINKFNPVIAPNGELEIILGIDTQKLGGVAYQEGELVFRPSAASVSKKSGFDNSIIRVEVWPATGVTAQPLTVYSGDDSALDLMLELWSPISIEDIRFDPPYLVSDGGYPKEIQVDEPVIRVRPNLPQKLGSTSQTIAFEFTVKGLDNPVTGQFDLFIKKPATLEVVELDSTTFVEHQLIPESDEDIRLTINNKGESVLRIDDIQVSPIGKQSGIVVVPEKNCCTIEPDKHMSIKLKALANQEVETGKYWFEIAFKSNDPIPDHNKRNLRIDVINEEYTEFIAVDFGTTDSTIAVVDEVKQKPRNIPLEKGASDKWIYSNLFFMDYKEQEEFPYVWCIGSHAKLLGPSRRERFVKAIKTKTGMNYKKTVDFKEKAVTQDLAPEEIINYIMQDLLKLTKSALRKKPSRVILSVPTRFTLRKKELLRECLQKAAQFTSLNLDPVEVIDESLAAGFFYLLGLGRARKDPVLNKESYNLMILDFGGGTTDVTVFTVHEKLNSDGSFNSTQEVDIVGAWGDATLGGEGITREIAQLLAERYLNKKLDIESDVAEIEKLEDEAEAVKLAVSELLKIQNKDGSYDLEESVKSASPLLRSSLLYILKGLDGGVDDAQLREFLNGYSTNGHKMMVFSNDFREVRAEITEKEVVDIFDRKLRKLKDDLQLLLKKIDKNIDVLLLAGRSSQFTTVPHVFKDLVADGNIDYVKDADGKLLLKECVSLGALFYSFHLDGDFDLKINGRNKIWTRIGWRKVIPGKGLGFEELIPWGAEYPYESPAFSLTRTHVKSGKLQLKISENLSLTDELNPEPHGIFEFPLNGVTQEKYPCKLKLNENGELKAFCQVKEQWEEMGLKL